MAASKFRFVSPGIQLREIDRSQIPDEPEAIGPVIIGRAQRGPGLRPVKVQSFTEFVEIFGEPLPGGAGGDVWRNGSAGMEPIYGAYAAQAWLANGSPLTYVRLLGQEHTDSTATSLGRAGWQIGGDPDAAVTTGGAYGLYVCDSGSFETGVGSVTGTLAAVWYMESGSIELTGTARMGLGFQQGSGILIRSIGPGPTFAAVVKNGDDAITDTVNFNVKTETAGNFIRKVFNTNPTKLTDRLYGTSTTSSYFLGESFEREVATTLASGTSAGDCFGFIAALSPYNETILWGKNYASMTPAQTSWIIAQDMGASGSFTPETKQELFQIIALDAGEWTQQNLKVSISDIRYSNEPSEPYGSFSLLLRKASDNDEAPQVVESFANVDLNPNSPNYIARRIGDSYAKWSDTDRRYRYYGRYANNSRYIYINMKNAVDQGGVAPELLPFGYQGPPVWGMFGVASGSTRPVLSKTAGSPVKLPFANAMISTTGSAPGYNTAGTDGGTTLPLLNVGNLRFTASFKQPTTWLRNNTTQGNLNDATDAFFGLETTQFGGSTRFSNAYEDVVRGLSDIGRTATGPRTEVSYSATGNTIEYSYIFSLDNVTYHSSSTGLGSAGGASLPQVTGGIEAYYISGSRKAGYSLSCSGSWSSSGVLSFDSYKDTLDADFDQFTIPMFGGFDGTDIRETNPFNNNYTQTSPSIYNSYKYNSVKQAIDSCADPELVECNLMAMPGIGTTNKSLGLTNHLLDTCQSRADVMAVIDIEGGYQPPPDRATFGEDSDPANQGKAATAASSLKSRQINNSYGACYYPWIQVKDAENGQIFFAPPSLAAMGTYAYSQAKSELWFAPAGFTRGGLTEGAGGIPIIGVTERLTSKDRDKLYENNINPIAAFPAEGLVMFGQKTLQATRSALDRINVRRLMIHIKKEISRIAATLLFDPNTQVTWDRFTGQAAPFLESVKVRLGLEDYKVVLDRTTTTPDLIDRNIMYAKIFLKPTRAIEFIAIDFIITNTGASFED